MGEASTIFISYFAHAAHRPEWPALVRLAPVEKSEVLIAADYFAHDAPTGRVLSRPDALFMRLRFWGNTLRRSPLLFFTSPFTPSWNHLLASATIAVAHLVKQPGASVTRFNEALKILLRLTETAARPDDNNALLARQICERLWEGSVTAYACGATGQAHDFLLANTLLCQTLVGLHRPEERDALDHGLLLALGCLALHIGDTMLAQRYLLAMLTDRITPHGDPSGNDPTLQSVPTYLDGPWLASMTNGQRNILAHELLGDIALHRALVLRYLYGSERRCGTQLGMAYTHYDRALHESTTTPPLDAENLKEKRALTADCDAVVRALPPQSNRIALAVANTPWQLVATMGFPEPIDYAAEQQHVAITAANTAQSDGTLGEVPSRVPCFAPRAALATIEVGDQTSGRWRLKFGGDGTLRLRANTSNDHWEIGHWSSVPLDVWEKLRARIQEHHPEWKIPGTHYLEEKKVWQRIPRGLVELAEHRTRDTTYGDARYLVLQSGSAPRHTLYIARYAEATGWRWWTIPMGTAQA